MTMENFAERLNEAIKKTPKKIKDIIEESGISRTELYYLRTNQRVNPLLKNLESLEKCLGVKLSKGKEAYQYKPLVWEGKASIELKSVNALGFYTIKPNPETEKYTLSFYFNEFLNGSAEEETTFSAMSRANKHFKKIITAFMEEI
jgi:hypothetical protein